MHCFQNKISKAQCYFPKIIETQFQAKINRNILNHGHSKTNKYLLVENIRWKPYNNAKPQNKNDFMILKSDSVNI